ncbi:MAG TPA: hypothetical protein PKE16_18695, partial [Hyphomicrobium sp.]|nr:hypothetical protein [Hyphomicrobium sp.]
YDCSWLLGEMPVRPGGDPLQRRITPRQVGRMVEKGRHAAETGESHCGWSCVSRIVALVRTLAAVGAAVGVRLIEEKTKAANPNDG